MSGKSFYEIQMSFFYQCKLDRTEMNKKRTKFHSNELRNLISKFLFSFAAWLTRLGITRSTFLLRCKIRGENMDSIIISGSTFIKSRENTKFKCGALKIDCGLWNAFTDFWGLGSFCGICWDVNWLLWNSWF